MNKELLRLVEAIQREREIDKEVVFRGIEEALVTAARKYFEMTETEPVSISINRETGEIQAIIEGEPMDPQEVGRIAAQTAMQVIRQKIKEAEREVLAGEFEAKKGTIVTGTIQRVESNLVIVNLGKVDTVMPRPEQIPNEAYRPGNRVRALLVDLKRAPTGLKILLSRAHPEFVIQLFRLEVPEIVEGLVEIVRVAREAGQRTKVGVRSKDPRLDGRGACIGARGSRIHNIIAELGSEKIDIVVWDDDPARLVRNALEPAQVQRIRMNPEKRRARVIVGADQLSLAIGKKGQNVRLAQKLCRVELDIITAEEAAAEEQKVRDLLMGALEVAPEAADRLIEAGFGSLAAIAGNSPADLAAAAGVPIERAEQASAKARAVVYAAEPSHPKA